MKKLILAFLVLTCLNVQAQKKIEKQTDYKNESVEMKFDLASSIEVKTWKKQSIVVEASIVTKDPEETNKFDINLTRDGSKIKFESNSKEIFGVDEDNNCVINNEDDFEFIYVVYVPEGVKLEVSSITGSLSSEFLKGDISVDLIVGNIDIKKFEGDLQLKTITGKISLPVKNASFKAKTVMGEIYASANPDLQKKEHFVGQEMSLSINNTVNHLSLTTVTGDIYLQ